MNKTLWRGAVAMVTAFACLALLASPASASVLTGVITAGTITLVGSTGTYSDTIPLVTGSGTGTGCAATIQVTATPTGTVAQWQITVYSITDRFKLGSVWFVTETTRTTSTAGTVTAVTTTTATLNTAGLTLRSDIYTATDQSDTATTCAHGTTRTCRYGTVNLGVQGTYVGNVNSPATSDGVNLTEAGTMGTTSPPCSAPFTAYNTGTVTVTGLVGHVTLVT